MTNTHAYVTSGAADEHLKKLVLLFAVDDCMMPHLHCCKLARESGFLLACCSLHETTTNINTWFNISVQAHAGMDAFTNTQQDFVVRTLY